MHFRQNTWLHSTSNPKGGSTVSWQTPQMRVDSDSSVAGGFVELAGADVEGEGPEEDCDLGVGGGGAEAVSAVLVVGSAWRK
jgi:hypothetical protein